MQRSLARNQINDLRVLGTKLKLIKVPPALATRLHVLTLNSDYFIGSLAEASDRI